MQRLMQSESSNLLVTSNLDCVVIVYNGNMLQIYFESLYVFRFHHTFDITESMKLKIKLISDTALEIRENATSKE